MWKKLKNLCIKYREFLMYLVFGVATTLVDALIYFPIVYLFVGKTPAQTAQIAALAKALAWLGAVIFAFFTNKKWVYTDERWDGATLLRQAAAFAASRLVTLGLSELITYFGLLLLQGWAWYQSVPLLAKHASGVIWVVQSVVVVLLNYILGKFLVFRRKKQQKQEQ